MAFLFGIFYEVLRICRVNFWYNLAPSLFREETKNFKGNNDRLFRIGSVYRKTNTILEA
jgi:hypothetical protein